MFRNLFRKSPEPVSPAPAALRQDEAARQWRTRGNTALGQGQLEEAARCYRESAALDPTDPLARLNLGYAQLELAQPEAAAASLEHAIALQRAGGEVLADAHYLLGRARRQLGQDTAAHASLLRALQLRPGFVEPAAELLEFAHALYLQRRPAEALETVQAVLAAQPQHPGALEGRGNLLLEMDRPQEALADFQLLLARHGATPGLLSNCAVALHRSGRLEEALSMADQALALEPANRDGAYNRGRILLDLLRLPEARATLAAALEHHPRDADLRWNHAVACLLSGDFATGWADYESRWDAAAAGAGAGRPSAGRPAWTGREDLRGRSILVLPEQGLGDSIQFARYLPQLRARGADVCFRASSALLPLLRQGLPGCNFVAETLALPPTDFEIPLLSLPRVLGATLDTVPRQVPYLRSDPGLRDAWAARLGPVGRRRVGLVWSGSSGHANDRNRSIPLALFRRLAVPGLQYVSLQKEVRAADAASLADWPEELAHYGEELNTLADTAAVIDAMDLVISVDTSVAHLAAALGKPTWILLPHVPDWRWLLEREDSPWYPTARLFRQPGPQAWDAVLARVRAELERFAAARGAAQ